MIENHIAINVRDIELTCPEDCPRFSELEERYDELLAEWEQDKEFWQKEHPCEPLPEELKEPPEFPECDECEYEWLKKEMVELEKARMLGVD